jgi:hypothetical protein
MATTRPFAYNTGATISGTIQLGNLAVGTPTGVFPASPKFWNGPDEDLGYVIAYPQPDGLHPNPVAGATASLGFLRSSLRTDFSFIDIAQYASKYRAGNPQTFPTGASAKDWLNTNGFWTSYQVNGSMYFFPFELPPPDPYVSIPNSTAFAQNTAFTIECWFYPIIETPSYLWWMEQLNFLVVKYDENYHLNVEMVDAAYPPTTPPGYSAQNTQYLSGFWHHVALSWNGTNGWLFVNGQIEATFTGAGASTNAGNPLIIGRHPTVSNTGIFGSISNFRVVKGTAVYTSPFGIPISPFTAISGTQLLLNTYYDDVFKDNSANNFTVTAENVLFTTDNPWGG